MGFAGAIIYCCFTFVSILLFPEPFSAFEYHLSKLGNSSANPQGAIFYNVGIFLTGLCLLLFYIGVYSWYTKNRPSRLFVIALLVGLFNAASLALVGVFSEDIYPMHVLWSLLFFVSLLPLMPMLNGFLVSLSGFDRVVGVFGFVVTAIDLFFCVRVVTVGTTGGAIFEWVTVFSFITWALLVTGNTLQKALSS